MLWLLLRRNVARMWALFFSVRGTGMRAAVCLVRRRILHTKCCVRTYSEEWYVVKPKPRGDGVRRESDELGEPYWALEERTQRLASSKGKIMKPLYNAREYVRSLIQAQRAIYLASPSFAALMQIDPRSNEIAGGDKELHVWHIGLLFWTRVSNCGFCTSSSQGDLRIPIDRFIAELEKMPRLWWYGRWG